MGGGGGREKKERGKTRDGAKERERKIGGESEGGGEGREGRERGDNKGCVCVCWRVCTSCRDWFVLKGGDAT